MNDIHDNIDAILPWYANASLDATETAAVEQHLAGCASCRDNLAFLRRFETELHADDSERDVSTPELPEGIRQQLSRKHGAGRQSYIALAASIALGLAVAFALGVAVAPQLGEQALYRTTTSPVNHDGPRVTLRVRLSADASASQLGRFIREHDAVIHAGPDEQGWYRMEISVPDDLTQAGLNGLIEAEQDSGLLDLQLISDSVDDQ